MCIQYKLDSYGHQCVGDLSQHPSDTGMDYAQMMGYFHYSQYPTCNPGSNHPYEKYT